MAVVSLLVLTPLSAALWFGMLLAIEAPTWMWVCFWVYVPALVVLSVLRAAVDEILRD